MKIQSEHDGGKLITITRAYFDELIAALDAARNEWLEMNPVEDDTDNVTPYDHLFYEDVR